MDVGSIPTGVTEVNYDETWSLTMQSCLKHGSNLYYLVATWQGYGLYENRNYRMGGRTYLAQHEASGWTSTGGLSGGMKAGIGRAVARHAQLNTGLLPKWSLTS